MKKKYLYFLFLLFAFTNCASFQKDSDDNYEIFNIFKNEYPEYSIKKEAYFSSKPPKYLIDQYFRLSVTNKNSVYYSLHSNALILNQPELSYMLDTYKDWPFKDWLIPKHSFNEKEKSIKISPPLYNKRKTKSLILVYIEKNNSGTISGYVLEKERKWKIVGGFPIGVVD
ncbi:hypothetical protein [Elizabethkingia meningoseptica]|uniref:hypothetical protein n=1 Tax=Elizabethkingia meningoseptica TaxID=238 RepID=UPI003891446E